MGETADVLPGTYSKLSWSVSDSRVSDSAKAPRGSMPRLLTNSASAGVERATELA